MPSSEFAGVIGQGSRPSEGAELNSVLMKILHCCRSMFVVCKKRKRTPKLSLSGVVHFSSRRLAVLKKIAQKMPTLSGVLRITTLSNE